MNRCDKCGDGIPPGGECWLMSVPVCGECFLADIPGPVCGDCTSDPTEWAEWAAMVDDLPNPADRVPCSRCGA